MTASPHGRSLDDGHAAAAGSDGAGLLAEYVRFAAEVLSVAPGPGPVPGLRAVRFAQHKTTVA